MSDLNEGELVRFKNSSMESSYLAYTNNPTKNHDFSVVLITQPMLIISIEKHVDDGTFNSPSCWCKMIGKNGTFGWVQMNSLEPC